MKRLLSVITLLLSTLIFAGSVSAQSITIKGSTTVLPIAQEAAENFMYDNPSVNISVQGGGSGVGIASIIDGTTDIGNSSRAIKDKELENAASKGVTARAHVVALDGIAVIVHPSNPLSALTKSQIKDIYTGKVSDWSAFGGRGKIVVISRDVASGTFEAFNELALNKERVRPDSLLQASNQAVMNTVARTPGAIGYIGLGYVNETVKALKVDGSTPSKETVLSGEYSLSRPLFMYTNGNPKGVVKDFLDYLKGRDGQRMVESLGYVGLF